MLGTSGCFRVPPGCLLGAPWVPPGYFLGASWCFWVPPGCLRSASYRCCWVLLGTSGRLLGASWVLLGASSCFWVPPGCFRDTSGVLHMYSRPMCIRSRVRNLTKIYGSETLCSVCLRSAALSTVHGYARIRSSMYV